MKRVTCFCVTCIFTLITMVSFGQRTAIIPKPVSLTELPGTFDLNGRSMIYCLSSDSTIVKVAGFLSNKINKATGLVLQIKQRNSKVHDGIHLVLKDSLEGISNPEGYTLLVTKNRIEIAAKQPSGLFYGVQTLCQLFPVKIENVNQNISKVPIPCLRVKDYPRFAWRGIMLDASRHFQDKEWVKKYIDWMAMYKLNIFHWHLTDAHGWRIQIDKYPKLTSIGAWRNQPGFPGGRYGGYYTKEEIREVVRFAKERFITIVPEVDVPGHSAEVIASYPELTCTGKAGEVCNFYDYPVTEQKFPPCGPDALCPGNDSLYIFLADVLSEVAELFPGTYFHIGGDECDKSDWKKCLKCQARIKEQHLSNEDELQSYFIKRVEKILNSKGKRLIGWDEILEGGLAPNATVMSWRGERGGIEAAMSGHDVVMSPQEFLYFDHAQSANPNHPKSWGPDISSLKEVYNYNPVPKELDNERAKHVLGAQANVWTVFTNTTNLVELMTFPRICALAEAVWTPLAIKQWDDFSLRMDSHYQRLRESGIKYYFEGPPTANDVK